MNQRGLKNIYTDKRSDYMDKARDAMRKSQHLEAWLCYAHVVQLDKALAGDDSFLTKDSRMQELLDLALILRGREHFNLAHYKLGKEDFDQAIISDSLTGDELQDALEEYVTLLKRSPNIEKVDYVLRSAVEHDDHREGNVARLVRAKYYYSEGRDIEAIIDLDICEKRTNDFQLKGKFMKQLIGGELTDLYFLRAKCCEKAGWFRKAVLGYEKVLSRNKNHAEATAALNHLSSVPAEKLFRCLNNYYVTWHLVKPALETSMNIAHFKLAFTLANILIRDNPEYLADIKQLIYEALEYLSSHLFSYKIDASREGDMIASYKLLTKSAFNKGFISESEMHKLDSLVEENKNLVAYDHFKSLEEDIADIRAQVLAHLKKAEVMVNIDTLKDALVVKNKMESSLAIAKISLSLIAGLGIDLFLGSLTDFSDIDEVGGKLFNVSADKFKDMLRKGTDYLKTNMDDNIKRLVTEAGYDPDELVKIWNDTEPVLVSADKDLIKGDFFSTTTAG